MSADVAHPDEQMQVAETLRLQSIGRAAQAVEMRTAEARYNRLAREAQSKATWVDDVQRRGAVGLSLSAQEQLAFRDAAFHLRRYIERFNSCISTARECADVAASEEKAAIILRSRAIGVANVAAQGGAELPGGWSISRSGTHVECAFTGMLPKVPGPKPRDRVVSGGVELRTQAHMDRDQLHVVARAVLGVEFSRRSLRAAFSYLPAIRARSLYELMPSYTGYNNSDIEAHIAE